MTEVHDGHVPPRPDSAPAKPPPAGHRLSGRSPAVSQFTGHPTAGILEISFTTEIIRHAAWRTDPKIQGLWYRVGQDCLASVTHRLCLRRPRARPAA
jgi:hypothetical protein